MRKAVLLILMVASLVLASRLSMAEAGEKDLDEIRISVEKSSLPSVNRASLLKKASEAVDGGLPSSDVSVIVKRGLARGVDGKGIENFIGIAVKAKEQGLPVRPVLDRIEQGLSKGVPAEKISAFSGRLVDKLAVADGIVNNLSRSGMKAEKSADMSDGTQAVARALEKAVPEDMIKGVGTKAAKKGVSFSTFNASMNTVSALVEMGMPLERAGKLINKAIDKGYSEKEMMIMERGMANELREGMKMEEIMNGMDSMMNSGTMGSWSKGMGSGTMQGTGSGMGSGSTIHTMPGMGSHHGPGGGGMGTHGH